MSTLENFVRESNKIEGILRAPTSAEIDAHDRFLDYPQIEVCNLEEFIRVVAPGKLLRNKEGRNVRVGDHIPPPGGPEILPALCSILNKAYGGIATPYQVHQEYETLHPFMDGNGRSGRVLWLWMMCRTLSGSRALELGFLHCWYYQSLQGLRNKEKK